MSYWLDTQDHVGAGRGKAPFCERPEDYTVYRNAVTDNFALGDGTGDQTNSLQCAINEQYKSGNRGNRYQGPVTCQPRVVFLPSGTYQIKSKLDLRVGTVLVGDPSYPPMIKAASDFQGNTLVNGDDFATNGSSGTDNFLILMKNIIIDTTSIPGQVVTAINWGVAQGCGLTNVSVNMPLNQTKFGHTGISLGEGSTITITDVVSHPSLM
jgi:glucan 1,3-beta-glucosidase